LTCLVLPVTSLPPSSYRLGVKAAKLHELFPMHITDALRHSVSVFDKEVLAFSPLATFLCKSLEYSLN
jgi:hypothetical protein